MLGLNRKPINNFLIILAVLTTQPITNTLAQDTKKALALPTEIATYCPDKNLQTVKAISVSEEADIIIEDGRQLRFANIFFPNAATNNKPSQKIISFLRRHLSSKTITFLQSSNPDRYERIPAHIITTTQNGSQKWFQTQIIKAGMGLFMPEPLAKKYNAYCDSNALKQLLQSSSHQNTSDQDIALVPVYAADNKALWELEGHFVIVEGVVLRTHMSEKNIFLNFGTEWKSDFTAVVSADSKVSLHKHFKSFTDFEGKRLQVRGFLDLYNGPSMRLDHPLQVELLNE